MAQALIGLGSNLGDRRRYLQGALDAIAASDVRLLAISQFHETQPVGGAAGQQPFLNAVAVLETPLPPERLLGRLHEIESRLSRTRGERWSARTIDLDLLLYDDLVLQTPELTVPHPRMAFRRFVLKPAMEVAPEMRHPLMGLTLRQLWEHLNSAPPCIAIAGGDASLRSELARRIASRLPNTDEVVLISSPDLPSAQFKLIFWLEAPEESQQSARLGVGPWLRLDAGDLDGATDEAVAAIQAMQ